MARIALCAADAGAGGARSRAISDRISANISRGTATSAIWNVTASTPPIGDTGEIKQPPV